MMGTRMMRVVMMNEGTLYYVGTAGRSDSAHTGSISGLRVAQHHVPSAAMLSSEV